MLGLPNGLSSRIASRLAALLALSCAACGAGAAVPRVPEPVGTAASVDGPDRSSPDRGPVAPGDAGGREPVSAGSTVPGSQTSGPPRVWLAAGSFARGAPVVIHFTAPAGFPADAWIGLLPPTVAHGSEAVCDQFDVAYELLQGRTSGTVTLTAPDRRGPWDARMFDTDAGGREVASITFQVR